MMVELLWASTLERLDDGLRDILPCPGNLVRKRLRYYPIGDNNEVGIVISSGHREKSARGNRKVTVLWSTAFSRER